MSITEALVVAALVFITLGMLTLILYMVRGMRHALLDRPTRGELENQYRQIVALGALYRDVGFIRSLPPLRQCAVSPDFLRMVASRIEARQPRRVLDLGGGASSIVVGQALKNIGRGHLWILEHDEAHVEAVRRTLHDHELDDWATVVPSKFVPYELAGQQHHWYLLQQLPEIPFDMVVIDGPPSSTAKHASYPALPLIESRLASNAVVIVDDTLRDDAAAVVARWQREYPNYRFETRTCEKGCVEIVRGAEPIPAAAFDGRFGADSMLGTKSPSAW
jgi:predicted O-methyltransferase YrrM